MADLNTLLSKFLQSLEFFSGRVSGVLTSSTTSAGTTAVTTEEDLWTYTLPANTLSANGKTVRISIVAATAANANNKTLRLYFGSTAIGTIGPSGYNNLGQRITADVIRTSATAQLSFANRFPGDANAQTALSTPAETLTGAVTIKVTGQNGTAAANDIVFRAAIVELLN